MWWGDVLSLLGILLVLLLVLAASYLVSRWAGQMGQGGRFSIGAPAACGRLRVLERLAGTSPCWWCKAQNDIFSLAVLPPDSPSWPN